jgi:aminoglycoside phosphotransferase family enzyme/predicted kinase
MDAFENLEEVCRAMSDPAFYPHPVLKLERRDTHISTVFLTGSWVYKLKKPVNFEFLDFGSLDNRLRFCRREVVLNQRLSHGIYAGIIGISRDEQGRFSLGGPGEVVEYAVKMVQLREELSLASILARGEATAVQMERLGRHLAEFYLRSERSEEIERYGHLDVVEYNMEENFRQVAPFVGRMIPEEEWEFIRQVGRSFFRNWPELFERRLADGRILDGHGDLRAEHIYFSGGIQIIDCIEFNDRFRYGDVASDLAFLLMDMEDHGHPEMGRSMLRGYVEGSGDYQLYSLLDFYCAYRAIVKMKVACLRSTEVEDKGDLAALRETAGRYLALAFRYALRFSRPTLYVCCGLPASGKSTIAGRFAGALGISHLQTDQIRKEEGSHAGDNSHVAPYGRGIYRQELRGRVYARMLALAQEQLKHGRSVVLDGSFSRTKWRDEARQLATDLDTNIVFMECVTRKEVLEARLKEREQRSGASDARLFHLPEMIEHFEPITETAPSTHLRIETESPLSATLPESFAKVYEMKCFQSDKISLRCCES